MDNELNVYHWCILHCRRLALLAIILFVSIVGIPVLTEPVKADEFEPYELTDNRTANQKIYQIGDNKYRLVTAVSDIHYYASGQWHDIDADYYETDSGQDFTAIFMKLPYIVRIADDSGRRIYPDRTDLSYWIQFYKPFPNMGVPQKAGGYWYWNFPDAIIAVRVQNTGVKFAFRLKNDQAPPSITIPFDTQGITRVGRYLYHDGEVIAVLRTPFAIDANGVERECDVEWGPGEVTLSLDTTGLAYPIEIDPSVEVQVGASEDDAYELGNGAGAYNTTSLYIYSNTDSGSSSYRASGYRFDGLSALAGVTVDNATLALARTTNEDDPNCKIYGEDIDSSPNFSSDTDVIGRDYTTAYVSWVDTDIPAGWNNISDVGPIIQEVIDRGGWDEDSITFLAIPNTDYNATCRITAQDAGDGYAAKLYVDYTGGGVSPPTVTTNTPNAVLETSANLSGNITATGGANATWVGFYYDDDGTPYTNSQGTSGNFGVCNFTENVTGLSPGTKYHYIASANNSGGSGNGSEITFITLPTGPTDLSVPTTGNTTVNLTWSPVAGGGVDRYEIRYAAGATPPSSNTSGTLVYNGTGNATQHTGLSPGTQYSYSLFTIAVDDGLESCSDNYSTATDWTRPGDVNGVSTSNVLSTQFQVDWTKGTNSENTTIVWRDDASYPANPADGTVAYNDTGTSTNVTGLSANTSYNVGMWGYDTDSGYWSVNGYFFIQATSSNVTAPTVTTTDASSVEETTATVGGNITNDGGENCTRMIYYDTDLTAPWSDNWTDAGTHSTGAYSHGLTGLNKGDKYAFMASANNTGGTGNGTVKYFMTKPDDPTSGNATGGTANISLAWTNAEGADNYYVYGKTSGYPSAVGDGTLVYSSTGNSTVHSSLNNNETWYYRVWSMATENGTTVYSDNYTQMTATTDTLAPTMQTDAATGVTYQAATLNGQVLDNGGSNPDVYFFYGTSDGGTNPAAWSDNVSMGSQGGSFNTALSSLSPSTTYFYTVRGVNGGGTGWGSTVNFTTAAAPVTTEGGGRPAPATTTTTVTSNEIPQLFMILPVAALSVFAFWKENAVLFYIAFGLSMITGLYGPDIAEGNTSTMGLMIGISFIAYALTCFAFGIRLTFWSDK